MLEKSSDKEVTLKGILSLKSPTALEIPFHAKLTPEEYKEILKRTGQSELSTPLDLKLTLHTPYRKPKQILSVRRREELRKQQKPGSLISYYGDNELTVELISFINLLHHHHIYTANDLLKADINEIKGVRRIGYQRSRYIDDLLTRIQALSINQ